MTTAEAMHAHLTEQHAAAERSLTYVQRHARAAAREHAEAPTPASHASLANAQASVASAVEALELAVARLADQALVVQMETLSAVQPPADPSES